MTGRRLLSSRRGWRSDQLCADSRSRWWRCVFAILVCAGADMRSMEVTIGDEPVVLQLWVRLARAAPAIAHGRLKHRLWCLIGQHCGRQHCGLAAAAALFTPLIHCCFFRCSGLLLLSRPPAAVADSGHGWSGALQQSEFDVLQRRADGAAGVRHHTLRQFRGANGASYARLKQHSILRPVCRSRTPVPHIQRALCEFCCRLL